MGALRVLLHESGRRIGANALWIASVAVSRGLPVVTQDDDFDVLAELGLVEVVRVWRLAVVMPVLVESAPCRSALADI